MIKVYKPHDFMMEFGVFLGLGYVVATVITAFVMYCVIKAL